MPLAVEQHHKLQYAASVEMVAQQRRNKIASAITIVPAKGEAMSASEFINAGSATFNPERSRENPDNAADGTRRWLVRPLKIHSGQVIDDEDKIDRASDPTGIYVQFHTANVIRMQQDLMLGVKETAPGVFAPGDSGGILGIAREGKTPGTGTALPAEQYIPHGSTGISVEKLMAALEKLRKADFGMDDEMDELFCAITPTQITDLLKVAFETKQSINAFDVAQLQNGKPTKLLGVTWNPTNRLPIKTGTTNVRLCPIWSKKNIIYGEWQGVVGDMWSLPNQQNLPYVYVSARGDCVRAQDKGVIVLECQEGT